MANFMVLIKLVKVLLIAITNLLKEQFFAKWLKLAGGRVWKMRTGLIY